MRNPWRRQGVGLALFHHASGEFWRRGERQIGLGVDAESATGASRLYERTVMQLAFAYLVCDKPLVV